MLGVSMTDLERYIIARWAYSIGEEFIGDIEYDDLHHKLKEDFPNNEYVNRSWSDDPCPIELLKKFDLMHLYKNITFVHKSESIRSINSKSEYEATFRSLNEDSRLSFKLDGFNIQVNYYNGEPISANTRGRSSNSVDASVLLELVPKKIPILGKVKVTGECVVKNSEWSFYKLKTGNTSQRASVMTAIANGDIDVLAFVAFAIQSDTEDILEDKYDVLVRYGFKVPYNMKVRNFRELDMLLARFAVINKRYDYPNDGLVLENSKMQVAIRVGAWEEEKLESYVESYEENVGLYGTSMIVNIHPVKQSGRIIRQVSVTNLSYILNSNLQIGAPIAFDNRSMTTAVLNTTRTAELHSRYEGDFEKYRMYIDKKENEKDL